MSSKALSGHHTFRVVAPLVSAIRPRRVDLVVTDYEATNAVPGTDSNGLHHEVRCTIPLAVIDDSFSGEALREMAQFCHPWTAEPISADELMQLLNNLFGALHHPPAIMPRPGEADGADYARIERLTPRERQVLDHVVAGAPNKRTAAALNISRRTVEHHRASIMQKTRTKSVSELVRLALRTGVFLATDVADA